MKHWLTMSVLVMVMGMLPVVAQHESGWKLVDAQLVSDVVGEGHEVRDAILAPDGSAFAWGEEDDLCLYTFADEATQCYAWLENMGVRTTGVNFPVWSPDSRQIAFYEPVFIELVDSDIWTFDVPTHMFTNRTNDSYFGGILGEEADNAPLDYLPRWNPADGLLYFFRSVKGPERPTMRLYRLPDAGGTPELVRDMTNDLPGPYAVYRSVAFSPDGTRLAMVAVPQAYRDIPDAGVWVYDLAADTLEHVVTMADLRTGIPAWQEDPLAANIVWWAGDDALVVETIDLRRGLAMSVETEYYVDLTLGDVTPLMDFSDIPNVRALLEVGADGTNMISHIPRAGAMSPDGGAFWFLTLDPGEHRTGISEVALPPTGDASVYLGDIPFSEGRGQQVNPTVSADGKMIINNVLVTLERGE